MAIFDTVRSVVVKVAGTFGIPLSSPAKATANPTSITGLPTINPPISPTSIIRVTDHSPPVPIRLPFEEGHPISRDFPGDLSDISRIGDRFISRRYEAHGGMGAVLVGYDSRPDDLDYAQVAIKVTSRPYGKLLEMEGKILRMIDSPHVPKYIETGVDESGMVFVAQEFIDGPSVRDLLETYDVLSPEEALGIIRDVCKGLRAAYELKNSMGENLHVMHKDIKPSNILIRRETGEAVVIDWGLSRIKTKGAQVGTPPYMSPEQMLGEEGDFRSDIYSVGIILFMLLYGNNPFCPDHLKQPLHPDSKIDANIKFNIIKGLKASPLPPFGVITGNQKAQRMIEDILVKMLSVEPADRHRSYDKLISEIDITMKELRTIRPQNPEPQARGISAANNGSINQPSQTLDEPFNSLLS